MNRTVPDQTSPPSNDDTRASSPPTFQNCPNTFCLQLLSHWHRCNGEVRLRARSPSCPAGFGERSASSGRAPRTVEASDSVGEQRSGVQPAEHRDSVPRALAEPEAHAASADDATAGDTCSSEQTHQNRTCGAKQPNGRLGS